MIKFSMLQNYQYYVINSVMFYCPRDECPNGPSPSSSSSSGPKSFVALPHKPYGFELKCPACSARLSLCENCLCLMEWDPIVFKDTLSGNVCRRCGFLNVLGEARQSLSSALRSVEFVSLGEINFIGKTACVTFEGFGVSQFDDTPCDLGSSVLSEFGGDGEFSHLSLRMLKELSSGDMNLLLGGIEDFLDKREFILDTKKECESLKSALNVARFIPPTSNLSGSINSTKILQMALTTKLDVAKKKFTDIVKRYEDYLQMTNEKLKELYSTIVTDTPTAQTEIAKYVVFLLRLLYHTLSSTILV